MESSLTKSSCADFPLLFLHAQLWADLERLVHNGIPSRLRPLVWPVLLRPPKAQQQQQQQQQHAATAAEAQGTQQQQHVCWTAEQYQPLLALQKGEGG
jgi:hypothetical protein